MSFDERVQQWARKMGYDGPMPTTLSKICNPSTAFVWEQMVANIKPRQEVAHIRKNVIMSRLRQKSLERQNEFSFPIKEIQVLYQKKKLERTVNYLEEFIRNKEVLVDGLLQKNKNTYMMIEHNKAKISEWEERRFLLLKKREVLEKQLALCERVLNLGPVDCHEESDHWDVQKALDRCRQNLQKIVDEIEMFSTASATSTMRQLNYSKSHISKYGKLGVHREKESGTSFRTPPALISSPFIASGGKFKRESLGLLSDTFLSSNSGFDETFGSAMKKDPSVSRILFSDVSGSGKKDRDFVQKLCNDEEVKDILSNLIHQKNRKLIADTWVDGLHKLLGELGNKCFESRTCQVIDEGDLIKVYQMHVLSQLQEKKAAKVLETLQESSVQSKEKILSILGIHWSEEQKQMIELQIEEAKITATNNFLRREVDNLKKLQSTNQLQLVLTKIKNNKEEITREFNKIESISESIQKVITKIQETRQQILISVKSLRSCVWDLSSMEEIKDDVNTNEVERFQKFPLEFNRKLPMKDCKIAYHNISITSLPSYTDVGSNEMEMLTMVIDRPWAPAEIVISRMFQLKLKLKALKSMKSDSEALHKAYEKYLTSAQTLPTSEEYIDSVIDSFMDIIESDSVKDVLKAPEYLQMVQSLAKEMPWRNFISEKRLVDGHNYKYYEKMLNNLCNKK